MCVCVCVCVHSIHIRQWINSAFLNVRLPKQIIRFVPPRTQTSPKSGSEVEERNYGYCGPKPGSGSGVEERYCASSDYTLWTVSWSGKLRLGITYRSQTQGTCWFDDVNVSCRICNTYSHSHTHTHTHQTSQPAKSHFREVSRKKKKNYLHARLHVAFM